MHATNLIYLFSVGYKCYTYFGLEMVMLLLYVHLRVSVLQNTSRNIVRAALRKQQLAASFE